ncbi:MAG: hypothetical protein EBS05_04200 [Proteobacteria bacterium]|nr:hypothetical protein [Pseudomonadota bacterium]
MNKVFAAMKPEVAAKTPRPVPRAKGERWWRVPAPAGEAALPAVARRSKLRDDLATQSGAVLATTGSAPASTLTSGGEHSGGRTV